MSDSVLLRPRSELKCIEPGLNKVGLLFTSVLASNFHRVRGIAQEPKKNHQMFNEMLGEMFSSFNQPVLSCAEHMAEQNHNLP